MKKQSTRISPALQAGLLPQQYNRIQPALNRNSVQGINIVKSIFDEPVGPARSIPRADPMPPAGTAPSSTAQNRPFPPSSASQRPAPAPAAPQKTVVPEMPLPPLENRLARGQKTTLAISGTARLRICFGWNVSDQRCDVDASVFPITAGGRVPSDDWFVFYGQDTSPDGSIVFQQASGFDRESIHVDLGRLDRQVQKLVFVITINEALENGLNFSMLRDTCIRVMDDATGR